MHSFYFFGVKNLNLNHHEQAAWRGWDLGYPLQRLRASCDAGVGLSVPPCSPDLPSHPSWWLLHGKYSSLDLGGCRVGRPGYQPLLLGCCGDVHPGRGVCSLCPPQVGSQPGGKGGNGSGKWAPCQSAGSLALKCWENLKKGEMFVGGKRSE